MNGYASTADASPIKRRHFRVAVAGLGLLDRSRLRAACLMLANNHVVADLLEWDGEIADLLVVGDGLVGKEAALLSDRLGTTATLAIGGGRTNGNGYTRVIPRGASVKEFVAAISVLLDLDERPVEPGQAICLLSYLRRDRESDDLHLLELGLFRFVVDPKTNRCYQLRKMAFDLLVSQADNSYWRGTRLTQSQFHDRHSGDVVAIHSVEPLIWAIAADRRFAPVCVDIQEPVSLRGWPELHAPLPVDWLLPLCALLVRPWTPAALVAAFAVSEETAYRLCMAVRLSGLVRREPARLPLKKTPAAWKGPLARLAGLLGLKL